MPVTGKWQPRDPRVVQQNPAIPMLPWHDIQTVFLDMDGTLLDLHFDNHFWQEHIPLRFAEKHDISIAAARDHLVPRFRAMEGTLDWYCVEYWSRELGLDIVELKKEVDHLIAVHEHVEEFLQRLRTAGKRVVMLTNAHSRTLDLKMEVTGINSLFDALIVSHDIGYPKEDVRFWTGLQENESFDNDASLFIDDSLPVLATACEYGIRHIVAMRRPDSRAPARQIDNYLSIDGFDEIMPGPAD